MAKIYINGRRISIGPAERVLTWILVGGLVIQFLILAVPVSLLTANEEFYRIMDLVGRFSTVLAILSGVALVALAFRRPRVI